MAGIGFRLQKLLEEGSYTSSLKAYAYSAAIAAGPFLLTVLVVAFIHRVSLKSLSLEESAYLQALITHGFAFSLIGAGLSYLVVTRYVADEYYRGNVGGFAAVYFSAIAWHTLLWGPLVAWHWAGLSASWSLRLSAFALFVCSSATWFALIFLSAAKNYRRIAQAFAAGALAGSAAAYALGLLRGMEGVFAGFVLGQGVVALWLSWALVREFGYREPRNHWWLAYFRKHPWLAATGFLYNLGIWADKILFWLSPNGESLDSGLRHCPAYDTPMFLAYLTIIPSLAYFLIRMETDFFRWYQSYYQSIQRQETLERLERRRRAILDSIADNFQRLLLLQGILSGLALVAVPWATQAFRLDPLQMGVLRIGIFAAFLQAGLLIVLNLLLYFDLQKEACASAAVFCAANAILTQAGLGFGLAVYGFGYALACLAGLMTGLVFLNERLRLLHYWTFMRQPIPRPVLVDDKEDA